MLLGLMHWCKDTVDEAASHLDRAVELDPDNYGIRALRWTTYLQQGDEKWFGMDLGPGEPATVDDTRVIQGI